MCPLWSWKHTYPEKALPNLRKIKIVGNKMLRCFNHNEKGRGLSSVRYKYGTFSILSTIHSCVVLKEMGHKLADRPKLTGNILTIIKRTAPLVFDTDVQIRG